MPVVINEFEVVAAPEAPAPAAATAQRPAPQGVTPQDVERIVIHARQRAARVRAD